MTVHPRICREQLLPPVPRSAPVGSSPHMQGTARIAGKKMIPDRFIPAYAGNSFHLPSSLPIKAVHPRICREQNCRHLLWPMADGSSPHMQGTVNLAVRLTAIFRFIPAYAGNSADLDGEHSTVTVHPRICREQPSSSPLYYTAFGSSPHMQGTVLHRRRTVDRSRFIPAYAGNRLHIVYIHGTQPVHPRICREQNFPNFGNRNLFGSSPHMQGTVHHSASPRETDRFIPAYAGNSDVVRELPVTETVHPRICREQRCFGSWWCS